MEIFLSKRKFCLLGYRVSKILLVTPSALSYKILRELSLIFTVASLKQKKTTGRFALGLTVLIMEMLIRNFSTSQSPIEEENNRISHFQDDIGNWITDCNQIISHTKHYFQSMFTTNLYNTELRNIFNAIPSFHNLDLSCLSLPLQNHEITRGIFYYKPFKAPGFDVFHPYFYQKHWFILSNSVTTFCHQIFQSHFIREAINITYLCLIPKFPNTNNLKNFRPIGLCNTIYRPFLK